MTRYQLIFTVLAPLLIFALFSVSAEATISNAELVDRLGYIDPDDNLILYNPITRTSTFVAEDVIRFVIARDGRVAYIQANDIYNFHVRNPFTNEQVSVNFGDGSSIVTPIRWSHDGQYLAVEVGEPRNAKTLYIWDGDQFIDIVPDNLTESLTSSPMWHPNGQLAFTVNYRTSPTQRTQQLYLWNGLITVQITDNPDESYGSVRWNDAGQLIFEEFVNNDDITTFMWDGVSYIDGRPDPASFLSISRRVSWSTEPDVVFYTSYPEDDTQNPEIIWWNMLTQTIERRHGIEHNHYNHYGYYNWIEGTNYIRSSRHTPDLQGLLWHITDMNGDTVFHDTVHQGQLNATGDYLAYCSISPDFRYQLLYMWDGEESWIVARVAIGRALRWQSTTSAFFCSD